MQPTIRRAGSIAMAVVCVFALLAASPAGAVREPRHHGAHPNAKVVKTRKIAPGLIVHEDRRAQDPAADVHPVDGSLEGRDARRRARGRRASVRPRALPDRQLQRRARRHQRRLRDRQARPRHDAGRRARADDGPGREPVRDLRGRDADVRRTADRPRHHDRSDVRRRVPRGSLERRCGAAGRDRRVHPARRLARAAARVLVLGAAASDRPAPARADRRRQPGLRRRRVRLLGGAHGTQRRDRHLGAASDRRGDPAAGHAGRDADPHALDGRLAGRARRRRRRAADDPGRADPRAVQLGLRRPAPDGDRRHRRAAGS